jgi:hypothetical protein
MFFAIMICRGISVRNDGRKTCVLVRKERVE